MVGGINGRKAFFMVFPASIIALYSANSFSNVASAFSVLALITAPAFGEIN